MVANSLKNRTRKQQNVAENMLLIAAELRDSVTGELWLKEYSVSKHLLQARLILLYLKYIQFHFLSRMEHFTIHPRHDGPKQGVLWKNRLSTTRLEALTFLSALQQWSATIRYQTLPTSGLLLTERADLRLLHLNVWIVMN